MNTKDLETLRYAQGWLDNQIESMLDDAQETPTDTKEWEAARQLAQHAKNMWVVVDRGIDALARENNALQLKISAMRIALDS